ncbi:MAG: hypothetical protein HGA76_04995, partial [Candidatus Firestonebacteria bacterium]|nr:hypothetical protein [Candidatus Firestonebacteria bacterium]
MKTSKPVYLLAGGHWKNPGVMNSAFAGIFQAVGKVNPSIAYLGTASGDAWMFYQLLAKLFKGAG